MNTKALEKVLSEHKITCTIHVFSDREQRHCSCGRDEALKELEEIKFNQEKMFRSHEDLMVKLSLVVGLSYEDSDGDQILSAVRKMVGALKKIYIWFGQFPKTGKYYEDGTEMSYGVCYGSNGERDYMRQVAWDALHKNQ